MTKQNTIHQSRDEFAIFVDELRAAFESNGDNWENADLPSFLEAMSAWVRDMDGYYLNKGEAMPTKIPWEVFANVLRASSMYE